MRRIYLYGTIALQSLAFNIAHAQRVEFTAPFAPSESLVKPSEKPYRQDLCLNGLWQFQPVALPAGFKEGVDATPELPAVTAGNWDKTPIRIPSPWNVNSFADKNGQGGDFRTYPSYPKEWENIKMGWLRKTFTIPANWKGQQIQLHFDAVAGDAEIRVNGKLIGNHFGIFLPFDLDITKEVNIGKENELCIGIRKASLFDQRSDYGRRTYQAGSFWGQHIAGIWQDVYVTAVPNVRISDAFVKPLLDSNKLKVEVRIVNDADEDQTVSLKGSVYKWLSKAGNTTLTAPLPSADLVTNASLEINTGATVKVPAHSNVAVVLSATVNHRLEKWSPEAPNLYGLVIQTKIDNKIVDSKYTRFGWRQATIAGNKFLLNGKPFVMKGDSWHFLGIPQMTRRYPWAWFKAMRDANLNAVRLHAQPYPAFYLDMADEAGILVLDETAVWASDGGPKLNSSLYWKDSEKHLTDLILRDRNHPSVFGWSVSNEVMPIVRGVMNNPTGMKDTLVKYYGIWADICKQLDPTRQWISADGEDDGEGKLPTYIVHYGGLDAMKRAENNGKPWGVGEAGNAYYGTPEQVSESNGGRAYESFQGRMEGVAASSYQSLVAQRERNAVYRSVFNLVWYGLQPLALGMKDTTKPPTLNDGIFFTSFKEGQPGVQPERLGPYCTTLNPGYDPALPLYRTWPLFDAIHDASAEPLIPTKWTVVKQTIGTNTAKTKRVTSIKVLSSSAGKLVEQLERIGVPVHQLDVTEIPQLLFVDGTNPPEAKEKNVIDKVINTGGTVVVWSPTQDKLSDLNKLLPAPIIVTQRIASSLDIKNNDVLTEGLTQANLYFSELNPSEVTTTGLDGALVKQSKVLLSASNTDWLKWNKQPEYAKTAMVLRSERETKPSGAVLILDSIGKGRLLVTTLPTSPRLAKAEKVVRVILTNLGVPLGQGSAGGKAILKSGEIVKSLVCGSFPIASIEDGAKQNPIDITKGDAMKPNVVTANKTWLPVSGENGIFDFKQMKLNGPTNNAVAYLSFWVSSPRNLDDLLIEPNIPVVDLEVAADDAVQVWLNDKSIISNIRTGPIEGGKAKASALKLKQGWNHFVIKVMQGNGDWIFSGRLISSIPSFLGELESAVEKP